MKKYLILIICLATVVAAKAQQIVGRAPSQVAVGEQFRLSYTQYARREGLPGRNDSW